MARCVESGTPAAEVARNYKLSPNIVRKWRDELRELGPGAFPGDRRRRFTKEIKEAAVRRVEGGMPLKEVARSYNLTLPSLRRWRAEFRISGADAFSSGERSGKIQRSKKLIFCLTEDEHKRLKAISKAEGARSISEFARSRLLSETARPQSAQVGPSVGSVRHS